MKDTLADNAPFVVNARLKPGGSGSLLAVGPRSRTPAIDPGAERRQRLAHYPERRRLDGAAPAIDGALVPVLGAWCPPIPGLFLYYPGLRHVPAALRAFIDVLKADG